MSGDVEGLTADHADSFGVRLDLYFREQLQNSK